MFTKNIQTPSFPPPLNRFQIWCSGSFNHRLQCFKLFCLWFQLSSVQRITLIGAGKERLPFCRWYATGGSSWNDFVGANNKVRVSMLWLRRILMNIAVTWVGGRLLSVSIMVFVIGNATEGYHYVTTYHTLEPYIFQKTTERYCSVEGAGGGDGRKWLYGIHKNGKNVLLLVA
jgi:hypothetical protein